MSKWMPKRLLLWHIILPFAVLANLAYLWHSPFGAIPTLGFFLIVPGYLLLQKFRHSLQAGWELFTLSMGLSLSILIIGGLVLNSLHAFGVDRPLTTKGIFIFFDIVTAILLIVGGSRPGNLHIPHWRPTIEQVIVSIVCTLLPLLAIGGAIRLNNGASNILTMIEMAMIAGLFILMTARSSLKPLYPYAIFTVGVSILFGNSLRGLFITGHDIHHEFSVFQATFQRGYWQATTSQGDPYNACLSITILPTLMAKLSHIQNAYIYKLVYQVLFASFLPTLYSIFKRFAEPRLAVLGAFVFMTFPTFTNDLPFLNRQEIAFIFFILLLLVNFSTIPRRAKSGLTIIFLVSLILSHYSSSYVTLMLLLITPVFFWLFGRRLPRAETEVLPLMRLTIILAALLCTFIWNVQVTASTGNLSNTIRGTFQSLVGKNKSFSYNLLAPPTSNVPQKTFAAYAATQGGAAKLLPQQYMPITSFGKVFSKAIHVHNIALVNTLFHAFLAKVLQVLVGVGMILVIIRRRRLFHTRREVYFLSLTCACLVGLVLFTVLPQLSVDYDVTRLFQQSLVVLWLPSILLAQQLFFFTKRYRFVGAAGLFAFLYLNLTGFVPELTGGFPAQLPLNNSGIYYDYFYDHRSDHLAISWLQQHRNTNENVFTDAVSDLPARDFLLSAGFVKGNRPGYLLVGNADNSRGMYRTIVQGDFMEYTNSSVIGDQNVVYSNGSTKVYLQLQRTAQ